MIKTIRRFLGLLWPAFDIFLSPIVYYAGAFLLKVRSRSDRLTKCKKAMFKAGVFPIKNRYSEPFPILDSEMLKYSLRKDRFLPGIDFNTEEQKSILRKFDYNDELLDIPMDKSNNLQFFYHNGFFVAGDAEYLYNIIRLYKPRKIIEIGSGYSTMMAIRAIEQNRVEHSNYICEHICIEPFENEWLNKLNVELVRKPVENIETRIFESLNANDILFIDSSHIIKTQGDILFEYHEILPILKMGVLVHIHDIFTPKDYPDQWITEPRFYNEQYLVEAFLTFNTQYKVIGALNYLKHNFFDELSSKCPILRLKPDAEPGSLWMIRN